MEIFLAIGLTVSVSIIRCVIYKKGNTSKKLRYYNYSKYTIKHKKLGKSLSEQSKNNF